MISIHWEQVNKYLMQYDKHYFEQQEVVRHTIYSLFMNCRIDKKTIQKSVCFDFKYDLTLFTHLYLRLRVSPTQ